MIYEIQKFGVTVQWTDRIEEAESAFRQTTPGGVKFYVMDRASGKKWLINTR